MAYTANLGVNQQLTMSNQGSQTVLSLVTSSPGQQQSQTSSFTTGSWRSQPQTFQIGTGFIIQIESQNGTQYIAIQGNSLSMTATPVLDNAIPVQMHETPDPQQGSGFKPMPSMSPMQPMKMGNMSMDLNSMSMQMGNMSLQMNNSQASTATKRFCSQCGKQTAVNARFCSSCGHQIE